MEGNYGYEQTSLEDARTTQRQGSSTTSTRSLIRTETGSIVSDRMRSRRNKLGLATFTIICVVGVVIGTGYIYLQTDFANDVISRNDVDSFEDENDGTVIPVVAEPRRATFIVPDTGRFTRNNRTIFGPDIRLRKIPTNTTSKTPTSFLFELVASPTPVYTFSQCPKNRPPFFKVTLNIGPGDGVIGFGTKKSRAKNLAAEDAISILTNITFPAPGPNQTCDALALRCGF